MKENFNQRSPSLLLPGLILSLGILLLTFFLSITLGAANISLESVFSALTAFDGSTDQLIIRTVRLPRSLIAGFVGASLAVSGALMQGLTRNPLASPTILGVNAGATFAVVIATFIFGTNSLSIYTWFAFLGAAITAILVYFLGSLGRGGLTPLNLTIAGAAITTFLASVTSGILIVSQRTLEEIRFWLAGSVAGRDINVFLQVFPYLAIGLVLAFALGKQITVLSLGEDVASGLGQRTVVIKILAAISIVLLAGSSVAIAGPIAFIGLVVPHIVRIIISIDYHWLLPYAAIVGAILLILADIVSRIIIQPQELPVGLIMPLIGAPFFIYLTRWKVK
ncbi:MAG: FecCD family ABC transporter permease [Halothece sp.]